MSLFDLFARTVQCPECSHTQAKRSLFGALRCPQPSCSAYDVHLANELRQNPPPPSRQLPGTSAPSATGSASHRGSSSTPAKHQGTFDPGEQAVEVRYVNARGEEKTYRGDRRTLRQVNQHLSLQLVPTGARCTFALDRLHNRQELLELVKDARAHTPTAREKHVLRFHARRGTTSKLYRELQERFPDAGG